MINLRRLKFMRKAGRVLRAHTVPLHHRQTVGEHTFGVLNILVAILGDEIWTASRIKLLQAALYHDATEATLGDTPANAKWAFAKIEDALKEAEAAIAKDFELYHSKPDSEEARLLKFADYMELAMFGLEEMKSGNQHVTKMIENVIFATKSRGLVNVTPDAEELYTSIVQEFETRRSVL